MEFEAKNTAIISYPDKNGKFEFYVIDIQEAILVAHAHAIYCQSNISITYQNNNTINIAQNSHILN